MYSVGLDLGQRRDHTAIAVVQRMEGARNPHSGRGQLVGLAVKYLERVPLGTSYPAVVERVRAIVSHWELVGRCNLTVDATGVGVPVVDMLRGARLGCEINAVTITSGAQESKSGGGFHVPKQDLLAGLQVLLEKGELRIARGLKEAGSLMRELLDVRGRQMDSGRVRVGADGAGQHDDLVIALALACWRAKRLQFGGGERRLPGM